MSVEAVRVASPHPPTPLALAVAMTGPEKKAERTRLMRERQCTELEAAYAIAERLAEGGA